MFKQAKQALQWIVEWEVETGGSQEGFSPEEVADYKEVVDLCKQVAALSPDISA